MKAASPWLPGRSRPWVKRETTPLKKRFLFCRQVEADGDLLAEQLLEGDGRGRLREEIEPKKERLGERLDAVELFEKQDVRAQGRSDREGPVGLGEGRRRRRHICSRKVWGRAGSADAAFGRTLCRIDGRKQGAGGFRFGFTPWK